MEEEHTVGESESFSSDVQLTGEDQQLMCEVLDRLNHPGNAKDTIHDILRMIKTDTGVEAVGIRLRGRIDPATPCFTSDGSFWTNNTSELGTGNAELGTEGNGAENGTIDSSSSSLPRSAFRVPRSDVPSSFRRCNMEGYESVALVPLRASNEIIGLLQLNDRQPNQFTLKIIRFLEGLGSSIGIALSRQRADEELKLRNAILSTQQEASIDGILVTDENGRTISTNRRFAEIWGMPPDMARSRVDECALQSVLHDKLSSMVSQVEALTHLTHDVCASLRLAVLDDLGLVAAVEWLAEDTEGRTGMTVAASLPAEDIDLDEEVALAAFRIVQEALANVFHHGQTAHVVVKLHTIESELELEIQDQGLGFADDLLPPAKKLGILGMHERAAAVGGTMDCLSKPGKGTTVRVRMPLVQGAT
ncbi:MAG: GAF domain-containing protein [Verrucomicrobia bacterium]|jgi:PAS domain-containing protein|nr:GAF domain-containing protein [Verrucomicrobiota bacterium]MBT7065526.1 GAF domain-containing protein [Verrucomicrobiota bacterium]MBT7700872.1 GAF domain-containing protein [Verrucomicrobiota bacterium]